MNKNYVASPQLQMMRLPWHLSAESDQNLDRDFSPFTLIIRKKEIGPNTHDTHAFTELQLRVSWCNSLEQIVKHVLATTKKDHPDFCLYFELDDKVMNESQNLTLLPGMVEITEGVYHCPKLVLVFDYGIETEKKENVNYFREMRGIEETFTVEIKSDAFKGCNYQFNDVLSSTIAEIKDEAAKNLQIPYTEISLSFQGKEAIDDQTLLDLFGLDIPPKNLVSLTLNHSASEVSEDKANIKERLRNKLTEIYTISLSGKTVDLSTLDCILHPDGYLLLNQYAQEAIKTELNLTQLGTSIDQHIVTPQSPMVPESSHPGHTQLGSSNQIQTNQPAAQGELPDQGAYVNIRFAGEQPVVNNNVPNAVNGSVIQLFLREIHLHVDELAQVFVRLALALALIGPQRAFYLLQPPLIYFLLVPTIWSCLFFYGEVIGDWIDQKILQNANRERIDYTIAKLISQVFRLAYALTTLTSSAISGSFKLILSLIHYNRVDLSHNSSILGRIKTTLFSFIEFLLVFVFSVYPFLGSDSDKFFEEQPHVERQTMQNEIRKILNSESGNEEIVDALGFNELDTTPETILSPDISARDYAKLLTIYKKSMASITRLQNLR